MPVQAACGVLSGAVSALATNPLDVLRTRIQVFFNLVLWLKLFVILEDVIKGESS